MPRQSIDCPSAAVPRPLRTGRDFLLVVRSQRVVQARWDKASYDPGEACELAVLGSNLGPLSLAVEAESEGGGWTPIATLQATPSGAADEARVRWRFPEAPHPAEFDAGHLVRAAWDRAEAEPGEHLHLSVVTQDMADGAWLALHVEREEEDGSWRAVDIWQGAVRAGGYESDWQVPAAQEAEALAQGALIEAAFDDVERLAPGATAWMVARTRGLERQTLWFQLEREDAPGMWAQVGSAAATVAGGSARAAVALQTPEALDTSPVAHLSPATADLGEALVLHLQALDAQGRAQLVIEAETPDGFRGAATLEVASVRDLEGASFRLTTTGEGDDAA